MAITVKKSAVTVKTVKAKPTPIATEAPAEAQIAAPVAVAPAGGGSGAGNLWAALLALAAVICIGVLLFLQWTEFAYLQTAFPGTGAIVASPAQTVDSDVTTE